MQNITLISVLVALLATAGLTLTALVPVGADVDMRLSPLSAVMVPGETFNVSVIVESNTPVNAFLGDLRFDPTVLEIYSISYNTSIADLWAEEPWYSNGAGTMNFTGGTTKTGGFTGTGKLLTITFVAVKEGDGSIWFNTARVLKHDGLGSDAVLSKPIDGLFSVTDPLPQTEQKFGKSGFGSTLTVTTEPPKFALTDLNKDGEQSLVDISVFMKFLATQNAAADFNNDGKVSTADLSILLNSN